MKLMASVFILTALLNVQMLNAFNCDRNFPELSHLNRLYGIGKPNIEYMNRNYDELMCLRYYLNFVSSIGYDLTEIFQPHIEMTPNLPKASGERTSYKRRRSVLDLNK